MKVRRLTISIFGFAIVCVTLLPWSAYACRCEPLEPSAAYSRASAVVIGEALESAPLFDGEGQLAIVKVTKAWKEATPGKIGVLSITNCSVTMDLNTPYILFLTSGPYEVYSASRCTGSKRLDQAVDYERWLEDNAKDINVYDD